MKIIGYEIENERSNGDEIHAVFIKGGIFSHGQIYHQSPEKVTALRLCAGGRFLKSMPVLRKAQKLKQNLF